jgi:hypothetical protein
MFCPDIGCHIQRTEYPIFNKEYPRNKFAPFATPLASGQEFVVPKEAEVGGVFVDFANFCG